jgi:Tfp pilus assembly protein PilF
VTKPIVAALVAVPILFFSLVAASPAPDPVEAARLNNLGVAYMDQQLFEKGLKAFEQAAAKDPALKIAALNRGVALLNLQKLEEARVLLEQATKDDPSDAHAWFNLGLYYKNSAEPGSALSAFRRVTEIDPNDADTWYFVGSTDAQLKQFPEAIAAFERALKIDPLHASAQFGLARAYQQSGQSDPAHEAMKRFQYVTQTKLGAPISLSYGEQGKYSRAEESPVAVQKVPAQIAVRFVDVTAEAGIAAAPSSTQQHGFTGFLTTTMTDSSICSFSKAAHRVGCLSITTSVTASSRMQLKAPGSIRACMQPPAPQAITIKMDLKISL